MNNLSSYCGLVDAKIRASDKDLPVTKIKIFDDNREHNKKVESGGKLCGTDKSQFQISSTLFRREATQNPIIITLLPARKDKLALISDRLIQTG